MTKVKRRSNFVETPFDENEMPKEKIIPSF